MTPTRPPSAVPTDVEGHGDQVGALLSSSEAATWVRFIGPPGRRLFSALHLPPGSVVGAVLVTSPIGPELARNYGREVALGRALARHGVATLRFHYHATGNSDGESTELGFEGMCADTRLALDHLRAAAGTVPVGLVGTRLGALVAANVARHSSVTALAMWAPVVKLTDYFREVFRARLMTELKRGAPGGASTRTLLDELRDTGVVEVAGYPITRALHDEATANPLAEALGGHTGPLLLLEMDRQGRTSRPVLELATARAQDGHPAETVVVNHAESWWFGASARDGAADATHGGDDAVAPTVRFLVRHLGGREVEA